MSYETSWLIDKRVLYLRIYGTTTIAQGRQMLDEARALCEQGTPFVYIISDATEQTATEFRLQDILEVFRESAPPIPGVGWSVYVGPGAIERFFFSVMSQLTSGKHRAFATLEEAIAFVQRQDETLPVIPMPVRQPQME
ncbi:MAG: hypothetical protein U0694_28425 [Anaerolineae bacterium]